MKRRGRVVALTPDPSPNPGRGEPHSTDVTESLPLSQDWERGPGGEGLRPEGEVIPPAPTFLAALRGLSRRREYQEILDQSGVPPRQLAQNLAHLRVMNRWLGWSVGVWGAVRPLLRPGGRTTTVLDIATGSGDVPRALVGYAARRGVRLRPIGSDASRPVLLEAARQHGPPLALVQHDATALPFADASVDVVTFCLAAHHLGRARLCAALAEMWRVARRGLVVSDLERDRLAYVSARAMALVLRNRLTSHDGPVSVLRAYSAPELRRIASAAGLGKVTVTRRFPFRLVLVARKEVGP